MDSESLPVTLREITRESLPDILRLKVHPSQERFVASNAISIAQAHFQPEEAWFRAIYLGDTPVGFVMVEETPARGHYMLWRFMIDGAYQGKGIGHRAIELVAERVRTLPRGSELLTSCVPGDGNPGPFYEKIGFHYTGEEDEGELVMSLALV